MSIFAQGISAPKYSNEFLSIGVGARALAMGGSQTAVANDVTAAFWNPAGLLHIKKPFQASLMHAEYFGGVANYDYAGIAAQLDESGAVAFSAIRMGIDNIPDTRLLVAPDGSVNYNNVGSFADASYAFLLSYARESSLLKGLKGGANLKIIHRTAGAFANAWGFGLDAGAQLQRGKWWFGLAGRDITSTFNVWNYNSESVFDIFSQTGNQIPTNAIELTLPRIVADVARQIPLSDNLGAVLTAGFTFTTDGKRNTLLRTNFISADMQAGMEWHYKQTFFLRAGVGNFQRLQNFDKSYYMQMQPSFGLGFRILNFQIDYALANALRSDAVLYSHVFSLRGDFEKTKTDKQKNKKTKRTIKR
ncbi:MAG: PorV/PorQ family protein [Bernardetiaceae bacterium]|nr:PorV/PorQ family protein [Bernardetiaceae bacterium]